MFQRFMRASASSFFKRRQADQDFKARSADRDAETDRSRVGCLLAAIENALRAAEQEQSGLNERVEDVLARAAVTLGNGTDESGKRCARQPPSGPVFSRDFKRSTSPQGTGHGDPAFQVFENGHVEPVS